MSVQGLVIAMLSIHVLAVQAQCPAPFNVEAGRCVFVNSSQSFNWCSANRLCSSMGGELINSYSSLQLLGSMSSLNCGGCHAWLGVSDLAEERNTSRQGWQLINGNGQLPLDASLWTSVDPNNIGGNQDCIQHYSNGKIGDYPCSVPCGFACEFAAAAPSQPLFSAAWLRSAFKRTSYNPSTEYCYTDLLQVRNAMHCVAAAMRAGSSSRHALYNSRLRTCRLLHFTDAQVEEAIETSPDWLKFLVN